MDVLPIARWSKVLLVLIILLHHTPAGYTRIRVSQCVEMASKLLQKSAMMVICWKWMAVHPVAQLNVASRVQMKVITYTMNHVMQFAGME